MIAATRKWFNRNRTNFAIGVGAIGVGYVATQYVLGKLSEARERMTSDRIAKENLRRRFEQNQEDCTFTVLALLPTAAENILEALPVESITHELQQKKAERLARTLGDIPASELSSGPPSVIEDETSSTQSLNTEGFLHASQTSASVDLAKSATQDGAAPSPRPKKTKVQLWNELKISSITRTFTLIYTLALLTLLTRIQLNLLGRRNYLSSVISLASRPQDESTISLENHDDDNPEQTYGNDFETNRQYLTFSWWLIHRGWKEIMKKVEQAVIDVFGHMNPRDDLEFEELSKLTLELRKRVEGETEDEQRKHKWLPYLLPPQDQENFVLQKSGMTRSPTSSSSSPALRRLLDETSDLVDSPTFTYIMTLLLDSGFSFLVDQKLSFQAFKIPPPNSGNDPESRISELIPENAKARVANILAVVTRQAHSIGNGMPNEYLVKMEEVKDLEGFAAVVYSSNWQFEGAESGSAAVKDEMEKSPPTEAIEHLLTEGDSKLEVVKTAEVSAEIDNNFENAWGKALEEVHASPS
ncbi:MAG: peroxin [Trizodia sp. TS-e1964]|nr:MAG: peroxin [Trizodia sp. TS-e1964]